MKSQFYLTTPIYYINDLPHLGHFYTTLAADVLARYYRRQGREVFFITGTDENSLKTIRAADKVSLTKESYTDQMAKMWRETWDALAISYEDFIRTTEARHRRAVEKFILKVYERGDIYKGKYEGLYCLGCENFKGESELVDGRCPDHQVIPEKRSEENYFFKLSRYQDKLLKYFRENPDFAQPAEQRKEMIKFIEQGLKDVSISRPAGLNEQWGIPLPFDKSQVIWVWFDALINYLSVLDYGEDGQRFEKFWPADLHLVGRDIFRFHAILWPAMLMSAGLPLPKKVFAHGFFTVNGRKMSKTIGNVIAPKDLAQKFGLEASRYLLLAAFPFGQDGDIDEVKLREKYNAELANGLGNLISRVFNLVERHCAGCLAKKPSPRDLSAADKLVEDLNFFEALLKIREAVEWANRRIDEQKLWQLVKENRTAAEKILAELLGLIAEIAEKLSPIMPETSRKILEDIEKGKISKGQPLFPRLI